MYWRLESDFLICLAIVMLNVIFTSAMFGNKERIRLRDVNVLTLKDGHMTTGRRSSPVKQLQCVGGTAGCSAFRPQVVQCYNRGSDGYDVQWECKSDMDNAYRFGRIEIVCEGYDHPDDEYILRGSCGLEYTIDLTKEGHQKQHQHNYYGGGGGSHGNNYGYNYGYSRKSSSITDWISLAVVALIIYALYKTCIQQPVQTGYADTDDGYGGGQGYWGGGGGGGGGGPPPPGFRPEYQSGSCGSGAGTRYHQGGNAGLGGGGFWTGAATGGLLGYMFGNRGNRGYGYGGYGGYARPRTGFGRFGGGGFGGGGFSGGGFSSGGSSGTRTASGFGSTRRR